MRMPIPFLTLLILATSPCLALTPQAADFIRSVGLNPAHPDVVAADKDGTIKTTLRGDDVTYSLETLATEKKTNAVKSFVATRKVARELKTNFNGFKMPSGGIPGFDGLYLTPAERLVLIKKMNAK